MWVVKVVVYNIFSLEKAAIFYVWLFICANVRKTIYIYTTCTGFPLLPWYYKFFLSPHHNSNNSHNNSYKKYDMYTQTTSHIILDTTNNNNIFPCVRVYVYLYVYVSSFVHQCATYEKMFCYDIMPKLDTKVQISDSIFSFVSTPNNSFLYLKYNFEKFFGFVQCFSIRKNQPKYFH